MKELDVLLQRWLKHCYPRATSEQRVEFDDFLDLPDPELLGYLVRGDVPTRPEQARIALEILAAPR